MVELPLFNLQSAILYGLVKKAGRKEDGCIVLREALQAAYQLGYSEAKAEVRAVLELNDK